MKTQLLHVERVVKYGCVNLRHLFNSVTFTDNDDLASDIFSTYWSRFAVNGNPNSDLRPQLAEVDYWPPYVSCKKWQFQNE